MRSEQAISTRLIAGLTQTAQESTPGLQTFPLHRKSEKVRASRRF
ncbi:hypothetical protein SBA5_650031 [Candidatus Sulfotelmatomonas gaucii]|uniref:Uncharacterized protein n=1 Tax=Candidatus Sulfuritelmatomonas gaucii TaxID=2043161 RepID=A0A2N9LYX2_9BACT|nr:hypothetical protein SBA5_650031 [Candidatus Sulfotelmatomonas gaucii]